MLGCNPLWVAVLSAFDSSSLDLNFAAMAASGTLDSRVTYSGASLATLTDATGAIAYKPHNLLTYSGDFSNAVWSSILGSSSTTSTVTIGTGASAEVRQIKLMSTASQKVSASVTISVASGTAKFRIKNTHGGVLDNYSSNFTATTTPQTFSLTVQNAASVGDGTQILGVVNASDASSNGRTFIVSGAWLNLGNPQPYYPTTSAAYYGPRFTYDPVTHAALGLLIEEQRTNLLLWSEAFDNAAWAKPTSTVSANAATAPDGNSTADALIENATTSVHYANQVATVVSGATNTFSVWAKANGRTQVLLEVGLGFTAIFNLSTLAITPGTYGTGVVDSTSIKAYQNGWYRLTLTGHNASGTSASCYIATVNAGATSYLGDGTSGIYLWGAQLEAGAFATSYIPTTSAPVTRAADSATMTGSNFSSWFNATQGTFVPEARRVSATVYAGVMATDNGAGFGAGHGMLVRFNNAGSVEAGGNSSAVSRTGLNAVGSLDKVAYNYSVGGSNPMNISANGGAVGNLATTDYTGIGVARLIIGGGPNGALNAPISRLRYYPTALTNAQLQALTT